MSDTNLSLWNLKYFTLVKGVGLLNYENRISTKFIVKKCFGSNSSQQNNTCQMFKYYPVPLVSQLLLY